jgi:hypothetical protein
MAHRLGSVLPAAPVIVVGPSSSTPPTSAGRWDATYPVDPLAKFVLLHFDGSLMAPGDRIEISLGYATDLYTTAVWGADFWTRPIRGNTPVSFSYFAATGSTGRATLFEYARGEAMLGDSTHDPGYRNTNADLFMIDGPYQEPPYYSDFAITPGHTAPSWQPVKAVTVLPIPDVATRVGMFIVVENVGSAEIVFPEDGTPPRRISSCTATMIASDLIITAGHCVSTDDEAKTGSFTLDYQTEADGTTVPPGYSPKFFKIKRVVRSGFAHAVGDPRPPLDYSILQIDAAPPDVPASPIPIRSTPVPNGEHLFIVHHRRGTPKKVSRYPIDNCIATNFGTDLGWEASLDHGSSGSSVFDFLGQIVANVRNPNAGPKILTIADDLITEPPPPRDFDVILVIDRSGSMSLAGTTGGTKMDEAKQAAALFVSLLRTDHSHRIGLVSFSTTATNDRGLDTVASAHDPLIAAGGLIPALIANGSTTIGGGLQTAMSQFPAPTPTTNTRAILLMTDGMENTYPWISTAEPSLGSTILNVVGFGTEANLDGPRLTGAAIRHNGIYMRANDGLSLKKFFALGFGHIFEYGTMFDPEYVLPKDIPESVPVDVKVCGETSFTAIVGWDRNDASLFLRVTAPNGITTIINTTAGVIAESGATWAHLRFALPFAGQRDGVWKVQVYRPTGGGEFPPPTPQVRYFLTVLVDGGPFMKPVMRRHFYTGDSVNPLVMLRYHEGGRVDGAHMTLEVTIPSAGTGNMLGRGLSSPITRGGDAIDARASTLIGMEESQGSPLVSTSTRSFTLFDDAAHDDGGMEPDGIYGNPIADLTRFEGNYTFHARATFGDACIASRETSWSVYVSVGIDPGTTTMTMTPSGTLPDGRQRFVVTMTPRDRYGSVLGPGRGGSFTTQGGAGSSPDGGVVDNGDGTYTQVIVYDPTSGSEPGVTIAQPDRPPVVVGGKPKLVSRGCGTSFWMGLSIVLFILLLIAIMLLFIWH